ncbi:MAG: pentapeptide repeat-containing protein [Gammaproteobacteria bacterium]|jgi:uncharacterized protein YjbI with pentapeptide repeats
MIRPDNIDSGIAGVTRRATIAFVVMTGLLLGGCGGSNNDDADTGATAGITTSERPWVKEAELLQDQSLYATLDQVVILDLEPASPGDDSLSLRNTIRFIVSDTERLSFCIPVQEPHLRTLDIVSATGETVLHAERGDDCTVVELRAGRYILHLFHDATTVDPPGKQAFFRWSNPPRVVLDSIEASAPAWDFFTFKAPNGKYVGLANPESNPGAVAAISDTVTPATVFLKGNLGILASSACTPGSLSLAPYSVTPVAGLGWFPPAKSGGNLFPDDELLAIAIDPNATAVTQSCTNANSNNFGACIVSFSIEDLGNYAINLVSTDNCISDATTPIHMDDFGVLKLDPGAGEAATEFTVDYTGYLCGENGKPGTCSQADLNLQAGEVAVFYQCNFEGPAIVFAADVPDFSVYDDVPIDPIWGFVYGVENDMMASVMVGPDTLVELWDAAGGPQGNTVLGVSEDIACLSGTALQDKVSQLKIVRAKQYIADTGGCDNCNLTGVDLSNTDLSGKSFVNTIFTNANLNGASFNSATLKGADFSGSTTQLGNNDFSGANLECTDFSGLDLTSVTFGNNTFTTDFTCRLNLASATFDYSTFADTYWRYFNMTGSTVNNVPATLSSSSAPLDLSGAELGKVTWLQGKALDYANLGCYAGVVDSNGCPTSGAKVCTTLTSVELNAASLTHSCLDSASLQGADLASANLEAADFTNAAMEPDINNVSVTLDGAFLRDATLRNANLTGASMSNASFYKANNQAVASGATMTDTDLSGAYLFGANFSGATLRGTNWSNAMLVTVDFSNANLSADSSGFASKFVGAYMQGAVFNGLSVVTGVDFLNTYWGLDTSGQTSSGILNYLLPSGNIAFNGAAGYLNGAVSDQCVQAAYPDNSLSTSGPPTYTDDTVTCPNGARGPCSLQEWNTPTVPFSGPGSQMQAATDPAFPAASTCTEDTVNFLWSF